MDRWDDGWDAGLTAGLEVADRLAMRLGYDCAEAACEALSLPFPKETWHDGESQ